MPPARRASPRSRAARTRILAGLCDVALVVGADTTPKGFLAPNAGDRPDDPDWLRFRLVGATNPTYFALYARRRMDLHGATDADFARVKVKNARHGLANPNARYRKEVTEEEVLASPMVADPLRLLEICATSDGGAAVVLTSPGLRPAHGGGAPVRAAGVSTVTPTYPNTILDLPDFATDSAAPSGRPSGRSRTRSPTRRTRRPASAPRTCRSPRSTTCRPRWSSTGTRTSASASPAKPSSCCNDGDTTIGGRIPVNPSGGLACFGEAVPAQALAQVCELTWQLRGQAGDRQVEGATVGVTVNQGLFGHGSSVVARAVTALRVPTTAANPGRGWGKDHDHDSHDAASARSRTGPSLDAWIAAGGGKALEAAGRWERRR